MITRLLYQLRKSGVWALVAVALFSGGALAAEIVGFGDAVRKLNGLEAGRIAAEDTIRGWHTSIPQESSDRSDYLTIGLGGKKLDSKEGSVFITVKRNEYPLANGESLFSLNDAKGVSRMWTTVVWNDGNPGVGLNGTSGYMVVVDSPRGPIPVGGDFTVAVAWKDGTVQVIANDKVLGANIYPENFSEFTQAIEGTATISLGAVLMPGKPAGAYEPISSKITAFGVYDSVDGWRDGAAITSVATDKSLYGPGQTVVVTTRALSGKSATFTVEGLGGEVAMKEVTPGVYQGSVVVPKDTNIAKAAVVGYLTGAGKKFQRNALPIAIDSTAPAAPARLIAEAKWGGEIEVSWEASGSADVYTYKVYRGAGVAPAATGDAYAETSKLSLTDTDVVPGITYYYAVSAVDKADNAGSASEAVSAEATQGDGPSLLLVNADPVNKPMRPGQTVEFTVKGATRGSGQVEILGLGKVVVLSEVGKTGVYKGSYKFEAADVADTTAYYQVVGKLKDDYGSSSLAGPQVIVVGRDVLSDVTAPKVSSVDHDAFRAAGFSGKLVTGDVITVTAKAEPKCFGRFSLLGVSNSIAMNEVEPGVYKGSYTIASADNASKVPVEAVVSDLAGNETSVVSARTVEIDTRVRINVTASNTMLPADRNSKSRVLVKATNANGDEVSGHEIMLKLHTTSEYTGVVGGGKVQDKSASRDDVDDIEVKWGGVTDSFGELAATYTAGFAAKTALIVAKDLTTGDVGAGWLNTYVASTIAIQLNPTSARELAQAPVIRMSATPSWLTADGRSKSRIRVWLTEQNGTPVRNERIRFDLANDNGSIVTLRGVTNSEGMAEADYRAGTVAGFVTIIASNSDNKAVGSIQIELRSDAPAKINMVATAFSIPADGRSTSSIKALVTDINDNANKQVPVKFSVIDGSGSVRAATENTDDRGVISALYTAGRTPGTAVVEARHTSRAPTTDELRRIYGTVFVPKLSEEMDGERVRVEEWYAKASETVVKGQALVKLVSKGRSWFVHARENGVLVNQVRHKGDYVTVGDTVGYVEIDATDWAANYK